ncbi:MAG: hypothetical protein JO360_10285 [Acidobacteria bacterium]|nr:hypothetical protein [Acidobacteriota bacterium]
MSATVDQQAYEQINRIRLEELHRRLVKLSGRITEWLRHHHESDRDDKGVYMGRHKSQLEAIESVLSGAIEKIHELLLEIDPSADVGAVYEQGREYEEALIWVERLWIFFREKIDQRDDAQLKDLLRAADEVVWSCYRQVFIAAAKKGVQQGPTPLTYIDAQYSPASVQTDKGLPSHLKLQAEIDVLDQYHEVLPIPLLRLPPWCIEAPWWLVFIGHEIGHHIQHELELVAYFAQGVKAAAATVDGADAESWGRWGEEIFADIFSIMMMGPSAVWAITEVEWRTYSQMSEPKTTYPPALVRLALMAQVADQLMSDAQGVPGTDGTAALRGIRLDAEAAKLETEMKVVPAVIAFSLKPLPRNLGTLQELCGFDAEIFRRSYGKAAKWSRFLRDVGTMPVEPRVETARQLTSGALIAWAELSADQTKTEAVREAERLSLVAKTQELLIRNAPQGTRAPLSPSRKIAEQGRQLIEKFRAAQKQRKND